MNSVAGECRCMLCVDYGDRDRWDDNDVRTIDNVNRFGRSCVVVGPTVEDGPPPFAYTTGMWHSARQPELAIYGIGDFELLVRVLNDVAEQAIQRGRAMQPGDQFAGALALSGVDEADYPVTLMPAHPTWFHSQFGDGLYFNRDNDIPYLQVVWPDRSGRLPGDADYDPYFADRQPQLWLPAADHPPSVWANPDTRALVPARLRRVLAAAVSAWVDGREPTPEQRLHYAVGITLDWLNRSNDTISGLVPGDVRYRADRAFVDWVDRSPGADEPHLLAALGEAARELLVQ